MSDVLRFRLEDGTEFDALVEGEAADRLPDAGPIRITADETEVEAHGITGELRVVVFASGDDVEGHSMTLRLPHPDAARDLQRKLLAAGTVGVVVIGAATTAALVSQTGAGPGTADVPVTRSVPAPPWWVDPNVRDGGGADATVPSVAVPVSPSSAGNPANRAAAELTERSVPVSPSSAGNPANRAAAELTERSVPVSPSSAGNPANRAAAELTETEAAGPSAAPPPSRAR